MIYSGKNKARLLGAISAIGLMAASQIATAESKNYNIPAGSLSSALISFSQQSKYVIVAPAKFTAGKNATSIKGKYTSQQALNMLLAGSGLNYEIKDGKTLIIKTKKSQKKSDISAPIHLASAVMMTGNDAGADEDNAAADNKESPVVFLDEIVVTASKRSETVQNIAYNITAITGNTLRRNNITDLRKLALTIPGMTSQDAGGRGTSVVIRGLTVSDSVDGSTVAKYINDTAINLDLKLLDINRVEVLRGPQGTLYGAGSLGGTIRYITNKPDPTQTTVDMHGKVFTTKESSGLGYDTDVVFNLPLIEDKVALRAVVGYLDQKGFVDYNNILLHPGRTQETTEVKDLNFEKTVSARASLLVNVNDDIETIASFYYQQKKRGGRTAANVPFTGDKYTLPYLYREPKNYKSQLFTFDVTWDLGFAELFSSTAYQKYDFAGEQDVTDFLITLGLGYDAFPLFSGFALDLKDESAFTQEIRLVSSHEGPLQWIIGGFYNKENNFGQSREFAPGLAAFFGFNRPDELEYFQKGDEKVREIAFFGELSYDLTERWTVTGGMRYFNLKTDQEGCLFFPLYPGTEGTALDFDCQGAGTINGINYSNPDPEKDIFFKFNTDYHVTDDIMVYATFSQGFRRGGVNSVPDGGQTEGFPKEFLSFTSDTVDSYELGVKSQFMDRRVTLNAAFYLLDWTDLQLGATTGEDFGDINITTNGGRARSSGMELELTALVTDALLINTTYSYTNSRVKEDFDLLSAVAGDPVPNVPKHKFTLSADYTYYLANSNTMVFHIDGTYSGPKNTTFPNSADNVRLPGHTLVNASITYYQENWSVALFADNLLNEYIPFLGRSAAFNTPRGQFNFINQPRTIGLDFRHSF